MSDRILYDIPQAAEQLSISARVLQRLIREGEVATVLLGRRRLVPRDALTEYVERLQRAT